MGALRGQIDLRYIVMPRRSTVMRPGWIVNDDLIETVLLVGFLCVCGGGGGGVFIVIESIEPSGPSARLFFSKLLLGCPPPPDRSRYLSGSRERVWFPRAVDLNGTFAPRGKKEQQAVLAATTVIDPPI